MGTKTRNVRSSIEPGTLPETSHGRSPDRSRSIAGALLSVTGIGLILSIIINEALYPATRNYSTFANTISDLGGTLPPNSYMVQPNRSIFIVSMALAGTFVLAATYLLWRVEQRRRFLVALGLLGVGIVGIAVFPGNVATLHPLFSLLAFVAGSIAAISSRKVLDPPLRSFAVVLGSLALLATVFGLDAFADRGLQAEIGIGGVERLIAYPVLLWLVLIGAAFMTDGARERPRQRS